MSRPCFLLAIPLLSLGSLEGCPRIWNDYTKKSEFNVFGFSSDFAFVRLVSVELAAVLW